MKGAERAVQKRSDRGDKPGSAKRSQEPSPSPPPAWAELATVLPGAQAKLAVSSPGDPDEVEADAMADRVMRMPEAATPVATACPQCDSALAAGRTGDVCPGCKSRVHRKEGTAGNRASETSSTRSAGAELGAAGRVGGTPTGVLAGSSGQPLRSGTRSFFEPRFGADFGDVRLHTGEEVAGAAGAFQARAFTLGNNIVFGPGEYEPESTSGRHLLAHELSHVVQQRRGSNASKTVRRQVDAGVPDAPMDAGPAPDAAPPIADAGVPLPAGVPPVHTGSCPTPEEESRKEAFRLRTDLAVDRFTPSTTLGLFDARYYPAIGLMPVSVKLHLNFVPADDTPDLLTLAAMIVSGTDVSRFFWSPAEESAFSSQFVGRVMARWSFRNTLRSTKPCWDFVALPWVAPLLVDAAANPHYTVQVHKSSGAGIDYKSGVDPHPMTSRTSTGTADFWESDVREAPSFRSLHVARNERRRIESVLAATGAAQIFFDHDSAAIRPAHRAALESFADGIKDKNPSDPLIPIILGGIASAEGNADHNLDLSLDRAEAVEAVLTARGAPQPITPIGMGPTGAPGDATNRRVDVEADTTFETTYAGNRYSVAEHEFGHMLGLPDEYRNNTTGRLGTIQTEFQKLVTSAGVAPPASGFGVRTSSQMASGVDVLPRHYVTIWEALGTMTAPDIAASEWSIE